MKVHISELKTLTKKLIEAGYETVVSRGIKKYSFNLIARKESKKLVVRLLKNIDSCRKPIAIELKKLAFSIGGVPLIVGLYTKNEPLLSGVVYSRFGIHATNVETFKEIVNGKEPIIYAKRGGLFVKVNGSKLRRLRESKGLSLGQLAKEVGVSRRAIYGYERGEIEATLEVAAKLEEVLGESVIKPISIASCREHIKRELIESEEEVRDPLIREIEHIARDEGFIVATLRKAPFELAAVNVEEESRTFIKTVKRTTTAKELEEDLEVAIKIAEITEANVIVLSENKKLERDLEGSFNNVCFVRKDELMEYLRSFLL